MGTPRLSTGPRPERQCQECPKRHTYRHEDAMRRLLGGDAVAIGRALQIPARTLRSYEERGENGRRGPGKQLSLLIAEAMRSGRSCEDAIAPVRELADENGFDLAPQMGSTAGADIHGTAIDFMAEAADVLRATHDAARNGKYTPAEVDRIEREAAQAIELLHRIVREAQGNTSQPRRIGGGASS